MDAIYDLATAAEGEIVEKERTTSQQLYEDMNGSNPEGGDTGGLPIYEPVDVSDSRQGGETVRTSAKDQPLPPIPSPQVHVVQTPSQIYDDISNEQQPLYEDVDISGNRFGDRRESAQEAMDSGDEGNMDKKSPAPPLPPKDSNVPPLPPRDADVPPLPPKDTPPLPIKGSNHSPPLPHRDPKRTSPSPTGDAKRFPPTPPRETLNVPSQAQEMPRPSREARTPSPTPRRRQNSPSPLSHQADTVFPEPSSRPQTGFPSNNNSPPLSAKVKLDVPRLSPKFNKRDGNLVSSDSSRKMSDELQVLVNGALELLPGDAIYDVVEDELG